MDRNFLPQNDAVRDAYLLPRPHQRHGKRAAGDQLYPRRHEQAGAGSAAASRHDSPAPLHGKDAQLAAPRYLNSRAWTIFGGTNEVQRTIIAKTVLGL